jgi:ribosome-binding ATPase YchF (GTP1/OBG family)
LADSFVRADVASASKLVEAGSWTRLREIGELKSVGRDHIVENCDVIQVHFSR